MAEKKLTKNEKYNNYKAGEAKDWAVGDVSQIFEARFDEIREKEIPKKDGSGNFKSYSLGVIDENGDEVYLSLTGVSAIEFKKLEMGKGSKFRICRTKVNERTACGLVAAESQTTLTQEQKEVAEQDIDVEIDVPTVELNDVEKKIVEALKPLKDQASEDMLRKCIRQNLEKYGQSVTREEVIFNSL